jgi:hypothetical protein
MDWMSISPVVSPPMKIRGEACFTLLSFPFNPSFCFRKVDDSWIVNIVAPDWAFFLYFITLNERSFELFVFAC